jgi:predicted DNA-binding protein
MARPLMWGKPLDASLVIRMTSQLKKRLSELAVEDRRYLGDYVRMVLEDHVDRKQK